MSPSQPTTQTLDSIVTKLAEATAIRAILRDKNGAKRLTLFLQNFVKTHSYPFSETRAKETLDFWKAQAKIEKNADMRTRSLLRVGEVIGKLPDLGSKQEIETLEGLFGGMARKDREVHMEGAFARMEADLDSMDLRAEARDKASGQGADAEKGKDRAWWQWG